MKKHFKFCEVIENKQISDTLFTLKIQAPKIAHESKPGQFINLYFNNDVKIFPRPFSISEIDSEGIFVRYKTIGSQTVKMSNWKKGDKVKVLGPLGNSFHVDLENIMSHVLVGGGIGVAPLFYLRDYIVKNGGGVHFFIGATSRDEHFIKTDDKSDLYLASDDGSLGFNGNVVSLMKEYIDKLPQPVIIYSCGPEPMLQALKEFGSKKDYDIQVSMEKIMGCGNGLCQGCAIRMEKHIDRKYLLACKDGPIFQAKDILIHD